MTSTSRRTFTTFLSATIVTLFPTFGHAIDISHDDFSDVSTLQLNGRAASVGNSVTASDGLKVLRLTDNYGQSGSAYLKTAVSLANNLSFSTFFQFRITAGGGFFESGEFVKGADGITFALNSVNDVAGLAGDGIGYQGNPYSASIEFDTFNNGAPKDTDGNHVGVNLYGSTRSVATAPVTQALMNNGQIWSAWIDYDGATDLLSMRLAQGSTVTRPDTALLSHTVDLYEAVYHQDVYFGFTSATGSLTNTHDILRWEAQTLAAPVPEPATLSLFGIGGLLIAGAAARRRT